MAPQPNDDSGASAFRCPEVVSTLYYYSDLFALISARRRYEGESCLEFVVCSKVLLSNKVLGVGYLDADEFLYAWSFLTFGFRYSTILHCDVFRSL